MASNGITSGSGIGGRAEVTATDRAATIQRFLSERSTKVLGTIGAGTTVSEVVKGQGFHWTGNRLATKPLERAKAPERAIIGEWSGETLYLSNLQSPLGKDILAAVQAAGMDFTVTDGSYSPEAVETATTEPEAVEALPDGTPALPDTTEAVEVESKPVPRKRTGK